MCNNARYLLYTFARLCPHEDATSSCADIFSLTCASSVTSDMHCDRPPKMEKSIWVVITVRSDHTKKFLGAKTKSLFGTVQIEIAHEILFTRKSSRTGPNLREVVQVQCKQNIDPPPPFAPLASGEVVVLLQYSRRRTMDVTDT